MAQVTCIKRSILIGASDDINHFEWEEFGDADYVLLTDGYDIRIDTYAISETDEFDENEVFRKPLFSHIQACDGNHPGYIFEHVFADIDTKTENNVEKVKDNYYRISYSLGDPWQIDSWPCDQYTNLFNSILQKLCPNAYGVDDDPDLYSSFFKKCITEALFYGDSEDHFLTDAYEGWSGEMHESSASEFGNLALEKWQLEELEEGRRQIICWSLRVDYGNADDASLKNADGTWNLEAVENCMYGDYCDDEFSKDHLFARYLVGDEVDSD